MRFSILLVLIILGAAIGIIGVGAIFYEAPNANGLWKIVFINDPANYEFTNIGGVTQYVSPDGMSVITYLTDTQMDSSLAYLQPVILVSNSNGGDAIKLLWRVEIHLHSVGTIIVNGVPTPVVDYTADLQFFDVEYAMCQADGTDCEPNSAPPSLTQIGERAYSNDWPTGRTMQISPIVQINSAAAGANPAGGKVSIQFWINGVVLTQTLQEY